MKTTDMIEKIKVGQKAYSVHLGVEVKNDGGSIIVIKDRNSDKFINKHLPLSDIVIRTMDWKLVPQEISLNKALSILSEGKEVTCVADGLSYVITGLDNYVRLDTIHRGTWYEGRVDAREFLRK